jgi:hypothetical protein
MVLKIVAAIVAVSAAAGGITWAILLYAQSASSVDASRRRRVRVVEVLLSLAMTMLLFAWDRRLASIIVGVITLVIALMWLFRGTMLPVRKGRQ